MKTKYNCILLAAASLLTLTLLTACGGDTEPAAVETTAATTAASKKAAATTAAKKETTQKKTEKSTTAKQVKADDGLSDGEYWCMGKNDTCKNKTYSASDLYCHSCDPDNNNIEGDQSKSYGSGGKVIDNDYDGDVDNDDWEKAWGDYLDDQYDKYGY